MFLIATRCSQPQQRTAVSGLLDRQSADEYDGGERLTTIADGRDEPGCSETAFQLGRTDTAPGRAGAPCPREAVSRRRPPPCGGLPLDPVLLTKMLASD